VTARAQIGSNAAVCFEGCDDVRTGLSHAWSLRIYTPSVMQIGILARGSRNVRPGKPLHRMSLSPTGGTCPLHNRACGSEVLSDVNFFDQFLLGRVHVQGPHLSSLLPFSTSIFF
jgi:hypothetical protein